jgi:hypothetical protein
MQKGPDTFRLFNSCCNHLLSFITASSLLLTASTGESAPANDDFANRILLTGFPVITQGDVSGAGKEPGEPSAIGYYTSTRTVWWSWVAPSNGLYAAVGFATNNMVVGVYTGSDVSALSLQTFSEESHRAVMNGQLQYCRQAEWNAIGGTTYQICIDGGNWDNSEVGLAITVPPQAEFKTPVDGSVFASPSGISVSAEANDPDGTIQRVDFYESHTGPGYGWSVPIGTLTNGPWNLTWNNGTIGNYPICVRVVDNLGAKVELSNRVWVGVSRPINDDFAQRLTIPNLRPIVTVYGSNTWASGEAWEPYGISSVWWSWTAPAAGSVTIDTCGSFDDASLKVFTGSDVSNLVNFGYAAGSPCASMSFVTDAGTTYHIAVEGGWAQGQIQLNLATPASPPVRLFGEHSSNGAFHVQTAGVPGQSSVLEVSTNLVDWSALTTNAYSVGILEFNDAGTVRFERRFYRVRQQ